MSQPFRWLCLSRIGTCCAAMAYSATLPMLREAWGMDATAAGSIQASYNITNAVAMLVAAWLCDHLGAKRVYLAACCGGIAASIAFALFARSADSALWWIIPLALTQGASYTPALILVAELVPVRRRGRAMGAVLAAGSFGYVLSISAAFGGASLFDYRLGFALCALGPGIGAAAGVVALRQHQPALRPAAAPATGPRGLLRTLVTPMSVLLTLGYTAHCWELLGSWAWMPSFLAITLAGLGLPSLLRGLVIACAVHLAGVVATLSVGMASDRWGRQRVACLVALIGACLSLSLGWSTVFPAGVVILLAALASFFILGDSGVLSAAMTETIPARYLGTVLAIRSIIGFSAGSLSPILFGMVLDHSGSGHGGQWGWAFMVLGAGGLLAALTAASLPKQAHP